MALSFGINDYIEGGVITAVILLNIIVGYAILLCTSWDQTGLTMN